jgi:hypothetical protein
LIGYNCPLVQDGLNRRGIVFRAKRAGFFLSGGDSLERFGRGLAIAGGGHHQNPYGKDEAENLRPKPFHEVFPLIATLL